MSRPRFLADHDLSEHIVTGVLRREPVIEFLRVRDVGMDARSDAESLQHAAGEKLLVVSHDAANDVSASRRHPGRRGRAMRDSVPRSWEPRPDQQAIPVWIKKFE
jgi:hypothetical protein